MRTRRTTLLSADRETQRAQQRTTQCCLPHQKRASMSRSTMWASASVPPDLACPELSLKNGALSWRDRQTAKFAARSSGPRKSASHSGPPPGWLWALPKQPQGWQHARERRHTPSWTLPPFLPPSLLVTLHPLELHHSVLLSRVTPKEATLGRVPGPRQGQVHCACTAAVACCAAPRPSPAPQALLSVSTLLPHCCHRRQCHQDKFLCSRIVGEIAF